MNSISTFLTAHVFKINYAECFPFYVHKLFFTLTILAKIINMPDVSFSTYTRETTSLSILKKKLQSNIIKSPKCFSFGRRF